MGCVGCVLHATRVLIQTARKDLLSMDFENILKYFRVTLPRKFLTQEDCNNFFRRMMSFKVSVTPCNMSRYSVVHVTSLCCTCHVTLLYMSHHSVIHVMSLCCTCHVTLLYMSRDSVVLVMSLDCTFLSLMLAFRLTKRN